MPNEPYRRIVGSGERLFHSAGIGLVIAVTGVMERMARLSFAAEGLLLTAMRHGRPLGPARIMTGRSTMMNEESVPRRRPERTGKHVCIHCLRKTSAEDYFEFDFHCRECAGRSNEFPLASTPGGEEADGRS